MTDRPLRIAIIGGGIGGLAAALTLLQAGHDVASPGRECGSAAIGADFGIDAILIAAHVWRSAFVIHKCDGISDPVISEYVPKGRTIVSHKS